MWDGGDGKYYLRNRIYDPNTGRFTSYDPTDISPGDVVNFNKYLYANANPVNVWDPSGHDGELASLLTTIGGIAALVATYTIPVVEAASPYLTALALVSFATDPEAAEQFIATGGDPEALVADLVKIPGLAIDDARSVLVFGRGLLQDAKALGVGGAEVNALRGAVSNAGGTYFEQAVVESLGLTETNAQAYAGATRNGPVNTVPDLPVGPQYGVSEIKSGASVTNTPQLQAQASIARQNDLPFNLIISPETNSISGPVIRSINETGGNVFQFDTTTGTWTTIDLPDGGPWQR
jgi:RHS repeat-associated protein